MIDGPQHSEVESGPGIRSGAWAFKSLFRNSAGACFRGKGFLARRDERADPSEVCERGTTKPESLFRENPLGGGSFDRGFRWLGPHSPLRGCSGLAASAPPKNPHRRTPPNFKTGSKGTRLPLRHWLKAHFGDSSSSSFSSSAAVSYDFLKAFPIWMAAR